MLDMKSIVQLGRLRTFLITDWLWRHSHKKHLKFWLNWQILIQSEISNQTKIKKTSQSSKTSTRPNTSWSEAACSSGQIEDFSDHWLIVETSDGLLHTYIVCRIYQIQGVFVVDDSNALGVCFEILITLREKSDFSMLWKSMRPAWEILSRPQCGGLEGSLCRKADNTWQRWTFRFLTFSDELKAGPGCCQE